jgi:hypothetical protein
MRHGGRKYSAFSAAVDPNRTEMTIAAIDRDI